jgi:hypothetical protein
MGIYYICSVTWGRRTIYLSTPIYKDLIRPEPDMVVSMEEAWSEESIELPLCTCALGKRRVETHAMAQETCMRDHDSVVYAKSV